MPYIQNSEQDRAAMLQRIGVSSVDALFEAAIPARLRRKDLPALPAGLTEEELQRHAAEASRANAPASQACFLGGGAYDHGWATLVDHLMQRSEFLTAYTPYQPECSQGTLQWIFEFQSMIAELCGLEVANASMYDGASAAAEAALMAMAATKRAKVVVSAGLHPDARATIRTYLKHLDAEVIEAPLRDGVTDWSGLADASIAAIFVQQPNFLGNVERLDPVAALAKQHGAWSVAVIDPIATGLLRSPGAAGFDVAVGDGQPLGVPLGFGGPYFGFFATRMSHVRRMPGRLVGMSQDAQGRRAFTLTFQTREQHIRREKATSNICTNNSLIALRGCIHMATLGPQGLEEVACVSRQRMLELAAALAKVGVPLAFPKTPYFREAAFRLASDADVAAFRAALRAEGLYGAIAVSPWYAGLDGVFTLACTERTRPEDVAKLAKIAARFARQEVAR
jgi:glycine dehydrogenase subunit 1